jgi:hypothetical protein
MADRLDLYFRAHTVPLEFEKQDRADRRSKQPQEALIFHSVSTADEKQELVFGAYTCAKLNDGKFTVNEIGLFHRDGNPDELRVLKRFVNGSAFELGTVEKFRRKVFLKYLKAGALILGYDMPFQISRMAVKWNKSFKRRRILVLFPRVPGQEDGQATSQRLRTGLSIESIDASKAIYRLIKYKFRAGDADREEEQQFSNIHILDLKTLTAVLTGETYSLQSALEVFGAPASRTRKLRSRVTKPAIEYLLRNVTGELELLNPPVP